MKPIEHYVSDLNNTNWKLTPYITAYLSSLLKFIDSLDIEEVKLEDYTTLLKGISVMGRKAERNQSLHDYLRNNVKIHLEEIINHFGFPMKFGQVEYFEINSYFKEACSILQLVDFDLFQSKRKTISQTITQIGDHNINIGSIGEDVIVNLSDRSFSANGNVSASKIFIGDNNIG